MAIIDITLKDKSGLELLNDIQAKYTMPVLIISMHDESLYAERVLKAGASGYIMKQEMTSSVTNAIRQVLAGKLYASESMIAKLLGRLSEDNPRDKNPVETLSDREFEVFQLVGKGYGRKEIAEMLGVSTKTIGTYRENIKKKLDLKNSHELMKCAIEWIKRL